MQAQTKADGRSQTILIVEPDEATRRILDLSLRNAGFAVGVASGGEEAAGKLAPTPDLLIASLDEAGLGLCRQVKQAGGLPPAVVLISEPDVDSKRRGLEAGADDFVARPIYVQEVVARARALLQRRERERIELAAQRNERFGSAIEEVPLIDLLRAIALNQKSGVATLVDAAGTRGEIFFRQGRVVDAEVGRLSGRDAVYRLFCWPAGRLDVEWKSIRRKDTIEMPPQDLLMEALRRVDEWRRLVGHLPPLDTILEVDYRLLAERLADIPDEVNRILRLFDGMRTVMQVIDDCGLPDLDAVAAIGKLCRERIVHDVRVPVQDEDVVSADMEGWLSDAAGPFRAPPRVERELFGVGPGSGIGVHGRPTAPLDQLGEGARDAALDADMRSRFTDRLVAEGQPDPPPVAEASGELGAPKPLALEVPPVDSGPAGGEARPTTLPGLGVAADEPAALPLSRAPRTTSGEILVKPALRMKPSVDGPSPNARSTDDRPSRPYMRPSQTATPPGSARALDELPPFTEASVVVSPALGAAVEREAAEPTLPPEAFDELAPPPSSAKMLWVGAVVMVVLAAGAALFARSRREPAAEPERAAGEPSSAPKTPPGQGAAGPTVEPLGAASSAAASGQAGRPVADRGDRGGNGRVVPAAALGPREDSDEHAADPKLARARSAEAAPMLAACHAAFADGRMKDAEAACIAARDANPESAEAYGLLAHALYNRAHRQQALVAAERAVKLNPKWADAYVIIGGVHQDAGDMEEAKRAYDRYLELEPKGQYAPDLRAIVGKLGPAKL
jgi:CheY-like chemotaxis protein